MLCAIYLVGLPFLAAWCLYRIGNPTVRLGVLIGIAIGIPLSYFAQPASIQMAMPLPVYVSNLIESLDVWHNGRVTDFLRFTLPMWMTCAAMALAGAIGARFLGRTIRKPRLQIRRSSAGGVIGAARIRLGGVVSHTQHSSPMPKNEENVLVIRRALFDELGAFQGLERDADRYIETFMTRQNNFFLPRSRAEQDPAFKQIIPYVIFTFEGTILRYVRGAKSGEKRLVDKASIGIGGHINDSDESLFSFDKDAYRAAVHREVAEELKFEGMWQDRLAALINDDSTEVGQVHLGDVHVVELRHDAVRAREKAIRELCFLAPEELRKQRDKLESWSQIVLDAWETL